MSFEVLAFGLQDTARVKAYDEFFEASPGAFIQQSTYWARVLAGMMGDEPIFLLCVHNHQTLGALPLYLYRAAAGNVLISVPHPGPLGGLFIREGLPPDERERVYWSLLERALELARECDCLAFTTLTNPFQDDFELYRRIVQPTFVFKNFTQYIRLPETVNTSGEIVLRDYHRRSNLSRNLRVAHNSQLTVKPCETTAEFDAFYRVHVQRHHELGAVPLPISFFEGIARHLEPHNKSLILIVKRGEEIASGSIYIFHRLVMDVLRLTSNSAFVSLSPNFLNTEHSLKWASQQGIQLYNWQSSPQRGDGVYQYKKQWSSQEAPYYFVTRLFCPPEQIQQIGLDGLKTTYANHFVVPYALFERGFEESYLEK